jgi:hypothetical protein
MVPIVVPTHGRAGRVTTHLVIDGVTLCVAESQAPAYAEAHPELPLEVHPDDVVGLGPKRQWIAERWGDVFMVDDDIARVVDLTIEPGHGPTPVAPERIQGHVDRLFGMATDLDVHLFSFSANNDARTYRAQSPFTFTGYVPGHAFGMRKDHKLWWHRDCIQEDFWISLLNAYFHRMIVRDNRFAFGQVDTFKGVGGLGNHRTQGREQEGFELLKAHFGDAVTHRREKRLQKSGKMTTLRAAHPWQPAMKLPW